MTDPNAITPVPAPPKSPTADSDFRRQRFRYLLSLAALVGCFGYTLWQLVQFALGGTLYSHIPLIPFVSGYLLWMERRRRPAMGRPARGVAIAAAALGIGLLAAYAVMSTSGLEIETATSLAFRTAAFFCLVVAITAWFCGPKLLRFAAFPLGFLVFMVPFPDSWAAAIETVSQYGSALVSRALFAVTGTPVFYQDLTFQLAGITFRVAPECSGIHSTLALFILSTVAGHLFLRSFSRAAILSLAVFPLALLRNGFRIFTIGELCVRIGPRMIDSPIHHQGGPIFFGLSLIPFLALLWFLLRTDRKQAEIRQAADPAVEG